MNKLYIDQQWISVKERLPEGDCLLLTASRVCVIGDFYDGQWRVAGRSRWIEGGGLVSDFMVDDITHWMPLPEPPKVAVLLPPVSEKVESQEELWKEARHLIEVWKIDELFRQFTISRKSHDPRRRR